jgi:DNA-directed RNA polymerase subunit RPC12/RpoP
VRYWKGTWRRRMGDIGKDLVSIKDVKVMSLEDLCAEFTAEGERLKSGRLSGWLSERVETRRVSLAMEIANRACGSMELVKPANQDYHKVTGYCECGNYFECTYTGSYYHLTCSKCGGKYIVMERWKH